MSRSPEFDALFAEKFETLLRWRRDVREFLTDPVPAELLDACLELANLAPSVGLSQPWRFVQVTEASARQAVITSFERCNEQALQSYDGSRASLYAKLKLEGLREAPCQIAIFCDSSTEQGHGLGRASMPEMLNYSVVMAVHTFWLAARINGLGVGWVSILDPNDVARACNSPSDWHLIGYLCIGWPRQTSETPKLELEGWEERRALTRHHAQDNAAD